MEKRDQGHASSSNDSDLVSKFFLTIMNSFRD